MSLISDIYSRGGINRIQNTEPSSVEAKKESNDASKLSQSRITTPVDRAELDHLKREEAKQLEAAKLLLEELPDVREEKVALARKRIQEGFYNKPDVQKEVVGAIVDDPEIKESSISDKMVQKLKEQVKSGYYLDPNILSQAVKNLLSDEDID